MSDANPIAVWLYRARAFRPTRKPGQDRNPTSGNSERVASISRASNEARAQGVPLWITSGKRSDAQQRQLWRDAIAAYGSPEAARRWVLPAEESPHVHGDAVDVGPREGASWLEANGNRWGLCRTFMNEWWHFELATTPGTPCPPMWPDAAVRADRLARH